MVLTSSSRSRSSQDKGHLNVKVIPESSFKCLDFYHEAGGGPSIECILVTLGDPFEHQLPRKTRRASMR